jgi:phosphohistidine phosphatase
MTRIGAIPDTILSSPAVRAQETARLAREAGRWTAPVVPVEELYSGGVRQLLEELSRSTGRVLAVGHEPTWSAAVAVLVGGGAVDMVTAAVACIEAPQPVAPGSGWLRWMLHPRLFVE